MALDATVSQLWLPQVVCDELETSLGLTYDPSTELYLVNSTAHAKLIELAPTIAFTLAADGTSNDTTTIVLPYAAFDLQASPPLYNTTTNYFPLRRASKRSVLGRAFLQEAYLVVDWDRSNFTISPAAQRSNRTRDIVAILPPIEKKSSRALSSGAIVGIVVGIVIVIVVPIATFWWRRRRSRQLPKSEISTDIQQPPSEWPQEKKIADIEPDPQELTTSDTIHPEAMSTPLYELHQEEACHQLIAEPARFELAAETVGPELEDRSEEGAHRLYRPISGPRFSQGEQVRSL